MKFKNILCLTKVSKNQTQTERNENTIIFNESKIELFDSSLSVDIQDREILYVGSSHSEKKKDETGKTYYDVQINWVQCFKKGENTISLPDNSTDILVLTKEIYLNMRLNGFTDDEIYLEFREKGLGYMSSQLSNVDDFSVLTASIIE